MKRILIIAMVIIGLLGVAIYVTNKGGNSTLNSQLSDFAVEDTAAVSKIFLADKNNNTITLTKTESGWMVNETYEARKEAVTVLLETLKRIKVRAPVSRSSFENIVKGIAGNSVKVEIYKSSNTPDKVFYVGGPNPDHTGSYMLMEGSNVPFLMHIEGFRGYLTPRFFTNLNEWRNNAIFALNPNQINSIELDYPLNPDLSWILKKDEGGFFTLWEKQNKQQVSNIDSAYLARYIKRYETVYYEGIEETKPKSFIDSIKASTPVQVYKVTDVNGKVNEVKVYPKPAAPGAEDYDGNSIDYDLDRIYGWVNENDFTVIQYIIFDPLKKTVEDFKKSED